jgi:hypothetical protein
MVHETAWVLALFALPGCGARTFRGDKKAMRESAIFTCDCTVETVFDFTMPVLFRPVTQDVTCRSCDAVYTVRFRKTMEGTTFTHKLTIPSRKLGEYLAKKKQHEESNRPQKKAKMIPLLGFKDGDAN